MKEQEPVKEIDREPLHPALYTIYKPNALIKAKGKSEMNLVEFRVYNEILAHNHKLEPDRLKYDIPIKQVSSNKNFSITANFISDSLQKRLFKMDKEFLTSMDENEKADIMSVTPFPTIRYYEKEKIFSVEIHPLFKKILLKIDNNFTKGDIHTLREFNHVASNLLYWEIRRRQAFKQTWETTFLDIKSDLGLENKYGEFRDFKSKVLDVAKLELKNTWCAFDYTLEKKGQGGKVSKITLLFKYGPKDEKNSPVGKDRDYPWEAGLIKMGMTEPQLKQIRGYVKAGTEMKLPDGSVITWDGDYVRESIRQATIQYHKQLKSPKPIKNKSAWLLTGLLSGFWNSYVEEMRTKIRLEVQTMLFK